MNNISNRKTVFSNFIWRFLERCGAQLVSFIVSIVLARILDPVVFGTVALVIAITTILQVFVDSGLGNALIQKKDSDDLDFSTVFYFNVAVCLLLYVGMFFFAPVIASLYKNEELTAIIRVLSLLIVISGVKGIQQAYVARNMLFKKFFFSTLAGTVGAAVVGILMAVFGFGVWALVAQTLFNNFVDTVVLWITVKWRPKLCFSFHRLKSLLGFGIKVFFAKLVSAFADEIKTLLIGKFYNEENLAYYKKANMFPAVIETNLTNSIDSVLLPVMSSKQDDVGMVKNIARKSIGISTYIMLPLMIGMAVVAEGMVSLILTDKWLPIVPYLQIFCLTYSVYPMITASWNAMKSIGKSGVHLFLETFRISVSLIALAITVNISPFAVAIGALIATVVSLIPIMLCNSKFIGYTIYEQIKDVFLPWIIVVFMGAGVFALRFIPFFTNNTVFLVVQVITGIILYVGLSVVCKERNFRYLFSLLKKAKVKEQMSDE